MTVHERKAFRAWGDDWELDGESIGIRVIVKLPRLSAKEARELGEALIEMSRRLEG